MRIALFIACFNDLLFPDVGRATVRLLEHLGHEVIFPEDQTCCGQIHFNTGYREEVIPLVRRFARSFGDCDVVVTPSPSCAAMVRLHHPVLAREAGDAALERAVAEVAPRVVDLSELLVDRLEVTNLDARFEHSVAFHPTCHSVRLYGIGDRPQQLLRQVKGLTLIDLGTEECCGFGGTFAVKNADTSVAMGRDKVMAITASGADILTAADTSCLMHLGGLLSRAGSAVRVMHIAEILAEGIGA